MKYQNLVTLLDELYLSEKAKIKIIDKDKSEAYRYWKHLTATNKVLDKKLLSDTTGENLAFTYFQDLSEKSGCSNYSDLFYVQKSYVGDYVTFYVKSRIYRQSDTDKIIYGDHLICEPLGKFKPYFIANWKFLKQHYPELIYVSFARLGDIPPNSDKYQIKKNSNIYQLLFGYEGNILRHNIIGSKYYRPEKKDNDNFY